MRAFIIRPFGVKKGIDFDQVEADLIDPALDRLTITGRTTMEIRRQGNIRLDMFQRLLTADLVIADISIQNANVYYELGVRHALRGKRTFLIRARGVNLDTDEVPFDLKTDRYLTYDGSDPKASLAELVESLKQTINSEAQDSPVFQLLPDLAEQERSRFLPVPRDFREEVERAREAKQPGDLELLAFEARGFDWEIEGLRLVGRAQFNLNAFEGARATWEAVRKAEPLDIEANTLLGTIYQRLRDLTRSDQALKRVLSREGLNKETRAEVGSLVGRNAKTHWTNDWKSAPTIEQRQSQALVSPFLDESLQAYADAFREDLNHFYSGLNALAMLTIQTGLADLLPNIWTEQFDEDEDPQRELDSRKKQAEKLAASVDLSLKAAAERLRKAQSVDIWAEISEADLCFLTSKKPTKVSNAYRKALAGAPNFAREAVRRQLGLYQDLGLLQEKVSAVLQMLDVNQGTGEGSSVPATGPNRVLLFTGHMVDRPNRDVPRFPNKEDKIAAAKQAIKDKISEEHKTAKGIAYGVAGCASGGDILFHQICQEMEIPTRIFLALPRDLYVQESVAFAGPQWEETFNDLIKSHPVRVLSDSKELPVWLQGKPDYDIWQRNNLWNLHNALADAGGENVTLIALWNGQTGDGPGGTGDMVQKARSRGAKTIVLETQTVFKNTGG